MRACVRACRLCAPVTKSKVESRKSSSLVAWCLAGGEIEACSELHVWPGGPEATPAGAGHRPGGRVGREASRLTRPAAWLLIRTKARCEWPACAESGRTGLPHDFTVHILLGQRSPATSQHMGVLVVCQFCDSAIPRFCQAQHAGSEQQQEQAHARTGA